MKLFKHPNKSELFGIDELTDDSLIALYNVCLNYREYLKQIINLPDKSLLQVVPGSDAKTIRHSLREQEKTCNDYVEMWNLTISAGNVDKLKN